MSLSEAEALKAQGNQEFQKGNLLQAISQYQQTIRTIDNIDTTNTIERNDAVLLRATLTSNTAMCHLKLCESSSSSITNPNANAYVDHHASLLPVIQDITRTIQSMDQLTLTSTNSNSTDTTRATMRSKLLYRRAKASYILITHNLSKSTSSDSQNAISNQDVVQYLTNAQKDLHQLLSFDPNNKAARVLLQEIKRNSPNILKISGASSSSSSPLENAVHHLTNALNHNKNHRHAKGEEETLEQALKIIHATLMDDLIHGVHELLKNDHEGMDVLFHLAFSSSGGSAEVKQRVLAMQSLAVACAYPAFSQCFENVLYGWDWGDDDGDGYEDPTRKFESKLLGILSSNENATAGTDMNTNSHEDLINAAMMLQMRLTLNSHIQQDDNQYLNEIMSDGKDENGDVEGILGSDQQVAAVKVALQSSHEQCRSMGLQLLSTWLEPNPLTVIDASSTMGLRSGSGNGNLDDDQIAYSKVKEPTEEEVSQMPARKLADYRKRCAQRSKWRVGRSRKNATVFCENGGLDSLISNAATTEDGYWRREYVLAAGRVMNFIRDETAPKGEDGTFVDDLTKHTVQKFFKEKEHQLTIEEVKDDDDLGCQERPMEDCSELMMCMKRCLFATALFLSNGEVGDWALKGMWRDSKNEWGYLATSDDHRMMAAASECASAAAGVEGARPWISSCIDVSNAEGVWKQLLSCDDREVRSGVASTMAKLGLADKNVSSDEGELFALFEVAAGLLEEDVASLSSESKVSAKKHSHDAPLERGIELMSYLSSKTSLKDEIVHGVAFSSRSSTASSSVLEKLVELADAESILSPAMSYSLATIFTLLSVSFETLRREAFEGKEITPEQYDELQAMGKTPEEKKLESSKKEVDDSKAVTSRIKKMVKCNVPRALVNLVIGGTEATIEQGINAMMRIACEPVARGAMIQQGCLKSCIKLVKGGDLKEREKKIVRLSQHTIAKLLITTNPSLLNTSQCIGSIPPLLMLVRDHDSSDLQKFEALLSLTNLASFNDSTKQRIVAERGIPILSYAMFSSHEMVQRAATEVMSNLVPNPDMILHLRDPKNLKLWIALGSDFDQDFECARAALGCLAMVTQDPEIALVLSKASNAELMIKSVLECGNLELMYRVLVLILNLMEHGGDSKQLIFSTGTVAFCEAYVQTYKNGGDKHDLDLSQSDAEMMKITVDLAKEIVKVS